MSLIERVMNNLTGVELVLTSLEGNHAAYGLAEVGVREIKAQTRESVGAATRQSD